MYYCLVPTINLVLVCYIAFTFKAFDMDNTFKQDSCICAYGSEGKDKLKSKLQAMFNREIEEDKLGSSICLPQIL